MTTNVERDDLWEHDDLFKKLHRICKTLHVSIKSLARTHQTRSYLFTAGLKLQPFLQVIEPALKQSIAAVRCLTKEHLDEVSFAHS